jgi:hypothetical protein
MNSCSGESQRTQMGDTSKATGHRGSGPVWAHTIRIGTSGGGHGTERTQPENGKNKENRTRKRKKLKAGTKNVRLARGPISSQRCHGAHGDLHG